MNPLQNVGWYWYIIDGATSQLIYWAILGAWAGIRVLELESSHNPLLERFGGPGQELRTIINYRAGHRPVNYPLPIKVVYYFIDTFSVVSSNQFSLKELTTVRDELGGLTFHQVRTCYRMGGIQDVSWALDRSLGHWAIRGTGTQGNHELILWSGPSASERGGSLVTGLVGQVRVHSEVGENFCRPQLEPENNL